MAVTSWFLFLSMGAGILVALGLAYQALLICRQRRGLIMAHFLKFSGIALLLYVIYREETAPMQVMLVFSLTCGAGLLMAALARKYLLR